MERPLAQGIRLMAVYEPTVIKSRTTNMLLPFPEGHHHDSSIFRCLNSL